MTQRIILFNGPPGCGKDTAARHIFLTDKSQKWCFDRMSMPIKRAFAATVNRNINAFGEVEYYESHKEDIMPTFGVSYRQWQIDFSETYMKIRYHTDIFSKLFIERQKLQSRDAIVLVPDCGFDIEYNTLCTYFGTQNVLLIKVFRPTYTFKGDSRNYITKGSDWREPHECIHLNNSASLEEFQIKALNRVNAWLRPKESSNV